jgi:hypothetical protein
MCRASIADSSTFPSSELTKTSSLMASKAVSGVKESAHEREFKEEEEEEEEAELEGFLE